MKNYKQIEIDEILARKAQADRIWIGVVNEVKSGHVNKDKIVMAMEGCNAADQFCLMKKIGIYQ